ncbi:MAG: Ig-like domain-containing protein [Janthinobacterium lividum]
MKSAILALLLGFTSLIALGQGPVEIQHAAATGGSGNAIVTLATAPKANNLLLAAVNFYTGYPLTAPTGWTLVSDQTVSSFGSQYFTHIVTAGETPTYTFTSQGSTVVIYEIAEYNGTTPINKITGGYPAAPTATTASTVVGTPSVLNTLALTFFNPDVGTTVASISAGWSNDGCTASAYHTECSATLNALTSDTTTPIQNTFTYTSTINHGLMGLVLINPGTAGTLPLTTPVASPVAGTYSATQSVTFPTPATGNTIHYTLDNSLPTCTSAVYSAALTIDASFMVNAITCNAAGNTSVVSSANYIVGAGTLKGIALGEMADLHGYIPFASTTPDGWQTDIYNSAVDPNSASTMALLTQLGVGSMAPDNTMTYQVVDSRITPLVAVTSLADPNYLLQSDVTMIPIPVGVAIESYPTAICAQNIAGQASNADNHMLLLDRATGFLYATWHMRLGCLSSTSAYYQADNISVYDITKPSSQQRPFNYTSEDAGGMSVFQGTLRYDEIAAGDVHHALRFTMAHAGTISVNGSAYAYYAGVAKHGAGTNGQDVSATNKFYYGMNVRAQASYTNSLCTSVIGQRMLTMFKHYGFIFADLGNTPGQSQITPDPRWTSADLACFTTRLSNLELVSQPVIHYGVNGNYPLDPTSVNTTGGYIVPTPITGTPVPTLTSFTASKTSLAAGECATVTATFTNATYGFLDQGTAFRSGESQKFCPTVSTTLKLTLQGQSLIKDDGSGDGATNANTVNGRLTATLPFTVAGTVTPVAAVTLSSVAVTSTNSTILSGTTQQFVATGTYSDSTVQNLTTTATWTSSNTAVATINSTGLLTAIKAGTITVTATSGSYSGTKSFIVTAPAVTLSSITVTPVAASITTGTAQLFIATGKYSDGTTSILTPSWTSSNLVAGTISSTGSFVALAAGTSTITATSGTVSATQIITVTIPVVITPVTTTTTTTTTTSLVTYLYNGKSVVVMQNPQNSLWYIIDATPSMATGVIGLTPDAYSGSGYKSQANALASINAASTAPTITTGLSAATGTSCVVGGYFTLVVDGVSRKVAYCN